MTSLIIMVVAPQTVLIWSGLCACGRFERKLRTMSSDTGVRLNRCPPSASEIAEVTAAAPEPCTGSPPPLTPLGVCGSALSAPPHPMPAGARGVGGGAAWLDAGV